MATKRGKAKKKNPCWKGYTAMGDDGKIIMKKKGNKMVPACRPIKDGASSKKPKKKKEQVEIVNDFTYMPGGGMMDQMKEEMRKSTNKGKVEKKKNRGKTKKMVANRAVAKKI